MVREATCEREAASGQSRQRLALELALRLLADVRLGRAFHHDLQNLLAELFSAVRLLREMEANVKQVVRIEPLRLADVPEQLERGILQQPGDLMQPIKPSTKRY